MERICLCSECGEWLYKGDDLVQYPVYDLEGDLDQILLAHRSCKPEWSEYDDHFKSE